MNGAAVRAAGRCSVVGGGVVGERRGATAHRLESPRSDGRRRDDFIQAREIVRMLRDCGLTEATIAHVIGTTRRGLPAWETSLNRPSGIERLQDMGKIVRHLLKAAATPREVAQLLCTPSRHLAGRRPIEVLAGGCWPPFAETASVSQVPAARCRDLEDLRELTVAV